MVKAFILVDIDPNKSEETFKKIKSMKGIREAMQVYGEYDAAFVIEMEQTVGVQEFVKGVRRLPGITRTVTLLEYT